MAATVTFPRRRRVAETAAAPLIGVGHVIGFARRRLPLLPGLAGAALASWGAALIYLPAGVILGGVFLLAADRQIRLRDR